MARGWWTELGSLMVSLWGVLTGVFLVIHLVPGDPARVLLGDYATPQAVAALRHELGLDVPIWQSYVAFLGGYLRGDLGRSLLSGQPVLALIRAQMPYTVQLATAATVVAVVEGVPLGVLAAVRRDTLWDRVSIILALLGQSTPVFLLGLVFILLFSMQLHVLPAIGGGQGSFADIVAHLIMPAVVLGAETAATVARMTRASMLEELGRDYVRTARAKGLSEWAVLAEHVLRNAAVPIATVVGLNLGYLLSGAVITEAVFARPGLGTMLVNAITARDYPVVQGAAFVIAVSFLVVNKLVDVGYLLLNPRLRGS